MNDSSDKVLMNNLIFILSLLMSYQTFAASLEVKKFDLNKNGKVDRTEYYQGKKLIKVEIDRNNDLKIDEKILYKNEKIFEIRFTKLSKKGNFLKKVTLQLHPKKNGQLLKTTYLDNNDDAKYDRTYKDIINLHQEKESAACSFSLEMPNVDHFAEESLVLSSAVKDGFILTGFGYKVDKSCVEKWGAQFLKDLKETKEAGLSCLKKIHKDSGSENITGALENASGLERILKDDQVKLVCSETEGYDWNGTAGHASTDDKSNSIKEPKAEHPYISLNPDYPNTKPISIDERKEIARTIFHEGLHNLGHKHGTGFEYAYPCETCCFAEENEDEDIVEKSCKLCVGDYEGSNSKEYVNDLIEWSKSEYREFLGTSAARGFIKEFPKSEDALILLAKSQSTTFNQIGAELVNFVKDKEIFTSMDNIILSTIISANKSYESPEEQVVAKTIAESLYYTYYEQDGAKALEVLEKNKVELKKLYKTSKSEGQKLKNFRARDTYDSLEKTIFENWLNNYPTSSDEVNTGFYELLMYIEEE